MVLVSGDTTYEMREESGVWLARVVVSGEVVLEWRGRRTLVADALVRQIRIDMIPFDGGMGSMGSMENR